ncbi:O-antigen ligase family protein [Chitinophagaceae bacterium LB-8]|uniref:O-antigen ligase family protein n=1 Tax=Paraflavisolibacter caeni TaxID=2982496 RepID=A0A9X2XTX2_9BACT|nr:O-antigen ligase family protein [Paraflavisolibacter caeni]MCU7548981.1 O-antigen ligase family protein [Paraflavisolibacter caeni]
MGSAILWCGLVQLGCKSIWFTELLILNILIPFYCYSSSNRIKAALVTLMVSSIAVIAILNLGSFRNRYVDGLKTEWSTEAITTIADPRIERWKAAIELIWSSPIVGYGSGDEVDLLKAKYFQKKLYDSYLHHLNAHNQYLSIWIKFGIIGLLVYLYTLLYGYKLALQSRNILFLSFLLLITIVSFSESILDANKSLFFYSFFFSFFVFSCRPEQRLQ